MESVIWNHRISAFILSLSFPLPFCPPLVLCAVSIQLASLLFLCLCPLEGSVSAWSAGALPQFRQSHSPLLPSHSPQRTTFHCSRKNIVTCKTGSFWARSVMTAIWWPTLGTTPFPSRFACASVRKSLRPMLWSQRLIAQLSRTASKTLASERHSPKHLSSVPKQMVSKRTGVWRSTMNEEASNFNFVFGCHAEFSVEKTG